MKKALLVLLFALFGIMLMAESVTLATGINSINLMSSTTTETILQYNIGLFEQESVKIGSETWHHITLPKEGISQEKGYPQLPVFNRSIIISDQAAMDLEVYDVQYQDIKLAIAPSKGVITRDTDPATVPYTFDPIYLSRGFYPENIASLSDPYILRDFRGITIQTSPFAYDPATHTLRIYTAFKIRVFNSGLSSQNAFTGSRDSISRPFLPLYENHFINWNSFRYTPVSDSFGKLLVICHTNYMSTILPYVNWKKQKGIETELIEWSTIGTTAAQLQTYIQNRYTADNTITYVQLVGDAPQIPSLSSGGGGSDPSFSLVAGSDNYPDIFIGRFSAETAAQVTAQINKAIAYERDATTSDTWLARAMGIASSEGGGSLGDNGESDIAHMNLIRTDLLNYGYTSVDQIYDPGASASTVTTNVNAGRGFINYVGHGSDTSWVTTGFNSTNATALTNGTKTPFIMDVACVNGNFVSITCFAEAWQRNANGGSVAIYASSINQSWNSPMRAQDEVTDLILAESKYTVGGLYYNGSCKMMDIYGNTAGSDGVNMFKTWHIFGDASLLARTKTPLAMTVNHPASIVIGASSVNVSTGVANTLVAITYNNVIYGRGYTNSGGTAVITLVNAPQTALDYTLTATAFNRVTYVGTIQQLPGTGPFMSVSNVSYADSNNNQPEYSDAGRFNVTFQNIGAVAAADVSATLSCSTPGISITDAFELIASLNAGASSTINNAFSFDIAGSIANGTTAQFTITMVAGSETWTHNFSLELRAPVMAFGNMSISDLTGNNNGRLDPGETATVSIPLSNSGLAASPSGSATLTCSTPGITVNTGTASFSAISAGGTTSLSFSITAGVDVTNGTIASLVFNATAGSYTAAKTETITVGTIPEAVLGTGTASTSTSDASPINIWYKSLHGQSVYTAAELNAAGITGPISITQIGFNITGLPAMAMPNFIVRIGHTSASNVASWISTGLTQVWSSASYQPSSTGWNMYTLSTPFQWNGTSNIVIDTAFGLLENYNQSGTVQYTSVTSGFRSVRSDTADQTNVFTGGSVSSYRPNVKMVFQAQQTQNPAIAVNPTSINETVNSGHYSSRNLVISNTGTAALNWSIQGREGQAGVQDRSISGSTFTCSASQYTSGTTQDWVFSVYNGSADSEWIKTALITFPAGVTVNSVSNMNGGAYALVPSPTSGNGITLTWTGTNPSDPAWGVIYGGQTATATVNLSISSSLSGTINLPWTLNGDVYGSDPHTLSGTISISQNGGTPPATWWSSNTTSGTIAPGSNATIVITLDTTGLTDGVYTDNLVINSNAANNSSLTVPISMTVTTPVSPYPTSPRMVAEWEQAKGALIRYPFGLPYGLIADLSNNGLLYVIVTSANQSTCNSLLSSNGANMTNVRYINAASDSYWTRDYGPWTVFDANNQMKIIDFNYNRPRPNDNLIPSVAAGYLGVQYFTMPLNLTGGNMMTDGQGKAMSSSLVLTENSSYTQAQINTIFQNYLGVAEYQLYTDPLANSSIDHIDCWAKLLDVDKVIIARVPVGHTNFNAIETQVALWQSRTSSYGTPYRIFRVDQSSSNEPYTNSYIMNKKIYVPQMGTANDAAALQTYRNAMPGYTVVGYSHSNFLSDDAIHCRVNTIFDDQLISINHTPLNSAQAGMSSVISTTIANVNSLDPATSFVAWKHGIDGTWQNSPLLENPGCCWTVSIPNPAYGQTLYYYVKATDITGRSTTIPNCGELDPFWVVVNIPAPNVAPVINLPASLSFSMNQSLSQDFSCYVSDANNDPLTLSVGDSGALIVQINGLNVNFSAPTGWYGTQNLSFTVSDGSLSAVGSIDITVAPLNMPSWTPVTYPNPPAVIYGSVTVLGLPAMPGDIVGAFCGNECRGTGIVYLEAGVAMVNLEVQLSGRREVITLRLYSHAEDDVYPVAEFYQIASGQVIGDDEPVPMTAVLITELAAPVVTNNTITAGAFTLNWNPVTGAQSYRIYACDTPNGEFQLVGSTVNLWWTDTQAAGRRFYKVIAVDLPSRQIK